MEYEHKINLIYGLKVKIKSLAEESKIIRKEEKKTTFATRNWLHEHRVLNVRQESRASFIAYAFLRNKPIKSVEKYPSQIPIITLGRAEKLARKYGQGFWDKKKQKEWKDWINSAN